MLAFLTLPGPFFGGLILVPLGMWLKRKREGRNGIYPPEFPTLTWSNPELRKLVYFVGATTVANVVIGSQVAYSAVNYMDSVSFCGKTCHTVMQPEFTAYQSIAAFARGVRQVPHRPRRGLVRARASSPAPGSCSR